MLSYAGQVVEEVAQEVPSSLPVVAGAHSATVSATDGAGNASEETRLVVGVPLLEPVVETATRVTAGDPLGVRGAAAWPGG